LLETRLVGLELRRALLELGVGLVIVLLRGRPPRQQVARPPLLHLIEERLRAIELDLGFGDLGRLGRLGLAERRPGRLELRLGLLESELVRHRVDH
jgi:hypothetical protein